VRISAVWLASCCDIGKFVSNPALKGLSLQEKLNKLYWPDHLEIGSRYLSHDTPECVRASVPSGIASSLLCRLWLNSSKVTGTVLQAQASSDNIGEANITPQGRLERAKPLCVQGCEVWNSNCQEWKCITRVHWVEQPQGSNGIRRLTAVKTARVASLSGLKTLSFPHTVRSYETTRYNL